MKGTMAKARCEEIIIDQYLKGNISNEFKDELLVSINARRDNEQYLEVMFGELKEDSFGKLIVSILIKELEDGLSE